MSSRLFCFAFKTYFFTSAGYVTNKQRQGSDYVKGKCHQATFWLQTSRNRPQTRDCPLDWARLTFPSSSPLRDLTDRECVYGGGHVGPKVLVCTRRCGTFQHQDSSPQLCIAQRLRPRARPQPTPISPNQFCTNAIRRRAFKCQCPAHLSDPSLQGRRF